ncbi:hypothetical protein CHO01_21900 [Cellulomonas hominis]|uniref:Uncharacterized protein n=1 Tax=Cellulomonas hominis TaxID=156981 RepID=A0A511FEQ4_9CELL|nr:hypothetical protein [Cellulomonas hominis]MBB5474687.1 hypothetical protein [Cellulomonas hominis]NKY05752.1 hypothetical protein [Cellulomonas hominis]GEL47074.1 hypothetical protein CHO01_21900 [Cellulomonas hominis]
MTTANVNRSPAAFVRRVRALAETNDWLVGDVDAAAVLSEALAHLGRTGAHHEQIAHLTARRPTHSAAALALEATTLLRDALALRHVLGRQPLSRSSTLAGGVPVLGPDGADILLPQHGPNSAAALPVTLQLHQGGALLVTDAGPLPLARAMEVLDAISAGTRLGRLGTARALLSTSRALAELPIAAGA